MKLSRATLVGIFALSALTSVPDAQAKSGAEWRVDGQFATRINPIGIRLNPTAAIRRGLFDSDSVLLDKAYVEAGVVAPTTPVSVFNQFYVELVPIAPIRLRATAQRLRYFGILGHVAEFEDGGTDHSPETLEQIADEGLGVNVSGIDAALLANLRLKFGPVLASFTHDQHWISVKIPKTSNWYDPFTDLMMAQTEQFTSSSAFLGYIASGDLDADRFVMLAGKYEALSTLRSKIKRQVASGYFVWRPGWMAEDKLTLGAVLGFYLEDAYREGQIMGALFAAMSWNGPLKD